MQNSDIRKGDKVRFLNEVGGGLVTRVEGSLVYVEDEIGFEVPVALHEIVLIEKGEDPVGKSRKEAGGAESIETQPSLEVEANDDRDLIDPSQDDSNPRLYLAFTNPRGASPEGALQLFLVNDSNFQCLYLITQMGEDGLGTVLFNGRIQPNTKEQLDEISVINLDVNWQVQLLLFRKDKPHRLFDPVNVLMKIKARRFFKDNSFVVNDFFYEKAVMMPLVKNEMEKQIEKLTDSQTRGILRQKGDLQVKEMPRKMDKSPEVVEVDLHINELLDDVRGLSNAEMLKVQVDRFNAVMEEYGAHKGQKIVFIHGIGNGTLKHEVRRLLNSRYKNHNFQDASFREYGYGATMVII